MLARLNSALGLAHPHYILLIHSMLWEIGANMELAMLSRRKICADRIKHPDAGTEAAPLNPLSAIAPLFRVRPEIQDVCRFALQWEVVHEAEPAGVCPPATCRAIRSRPDGVRRAFLCMSSGPLLRKLKPRQLQLPQSGPDGQPIESSHL